MLHGAGLASENCPLLDFKFNGKQNVITYTIEPLNEAAAIHAPPRRNMLYFADRQWKCICAIMFVVNNKVNGKWIKFECNGAKTESHLTPAYRDHFGFLSPRACLWPGFKILPTPSRRPRGQPWCKNTLAERVVLKVKIE